MRVQNSYCRTVVGWLSAVIVSMIVSVVPSLIRSAQEPAEMPRIREHALRVAVQLDAEATATASSDHVRILEGLAPGERVVTKGAVLIKGQEAKAPVA